MAFLAKICNFFDSFKSINCFFKLSSHLNREAGTSKQVFTKNEADAAASCTPSVPRSSQTHQRDASAVEWQADEGAKRSGKSYYIFIYTLIYFLHFDL